MLRQGTISHNEISSELKYPVVSMVISLLLIYAAPLTSLLLNYIAFAILCYRIVRYDESVFGIDYCVLAGVSYIFVSTGRVSLLAWLSIVGAIWYVIRNGIVVNSGLITFILLFDFLLMRMQTAINSFVLCFSQIVLLYVLLSAQKIERIPQSAKAFCGNIVLSSWYALLLRNHPKIRGLLGKEVIAYWGSRQTRFQGLLRDPNYYMTLVVVGISLLAVLYLNHYISVRYFAVNGGCLLFFGSITYSKTFIVGLGVSVLLFLAMLIYKKRYGWAAVTLCGIVGLSVVMARTLFAVILYRITSADNLYDLTTGRSELIVEYLGEITRSARVLFFGSGLSAEILKRGTHNIFLEIIFYFGLIGLVLFAVYVASLIQLLREKVRHNPNGPFRYTVFVIFLVLFCTLQGITFTITYIMLYLSILATAVTPCRTEGTLPEQAQMEKS